MGEGDGWDMVCACWVRAWMMGSILFVTVMLDERRATSEG